MADVVISYGRDQEAMAAKVAHAVAAEGYEVWWDENIPAHRAYGALIEEKVQGAKAVLVIWSASAVKSEWVRAEADMARNQQKLIQVSVDGTIPPLPFNQIQFAPISAWDGTPEHPEWRRVRASLRTLCGAKAPGPWDAPPPPASSAPKAKAVPAQAPAGLRRQPFFLLAAALLAVAAFGVMMTQQTGTASGPTPGPVPPPEAAPRPAPVPPPAAPEENRADFILPTSGSEPLDAADIAALDRAQLRIARNEIYARHGRIFKSADLAAHFATFGWYRPLTDTVTLTPVETANVALLQAAENRR